MNWDEIRWAIRTETKKRTEKGGGRAVTSRSSLNLMTHRDDLFFLWVDNVWTTVSSYLNWSCWVVFCYIEQQSGLPNIWFALGLCKKRHGYTEDNCFLVNCLLPSHLFSSFFIFFSFCFCAISVVLRVVIFGSSSTSFPPASNTVTSVSNGSGAVQILYQLSPGSGAHMAPMGHWWLWT